MVEKIGTIKNPLTIIAIFAAIAEISGTLVLPFIAPQNQAVYVWFLIVFPVLLIILFFATLNFNHRVLYAPSDYQNEDNFVKSLQPATYAEKALQVEAELDEIELAPVAEVVSTPASVPPAVTQVQSPEPMQIVSNHSRSLRHNYFRAEEFIFRKLSREFSTVIRREVRVHGQSSRYIFDGVVYDKGVTTVIEVKLLRGASMFPRLRETFRKIHDSVKDFPENRRDNLRLLLALAVDETINGDHILSMIDQYRTEFPFPIEVRFYKLSDIEREDVFGD